MRASDERILLGAAVAFIIWFFAFLPAYYDSYRGAAVVWDFVSALLCVGVIVLVLPKIWARIHGLFETFSDLAAPIFVLALASVIYSTAQMREVLWIKFASVTDLQVWYAPLKLMGAIFTTDGWATSSILLLVIALGVWGPAHFYKYSDVVGAYRLYPNTKDIAVRLLQIMSQANRFGAAWALAPSLPVIVFYNTIVPAFPQQGILFYLGWEILFYVLLLISIFFLVYLYTALVLLTSGGSRWRLEFITNAFPYLHLDKFIAMFNRLPRLPNNFLNAKANRGLLETAVFVLFVLAIFAFLLFFIVPLVFLVFELNIMSIVQNEIFTINVFLAASLSFTAMLFGLAREQKRWYGLYVIVAIVLAFAFFDLDDNHAIRRFVAPSMATQNAKPVTLEEGFRTWMDSRSDRAQFKDGEYPVFIVAAEGGGIYAAYHAGMLLAAVQDRYPEFAQHVFAISAVSGGALGASVFASLVKTRAEGAAAKPSNEWYSTAARNLLKQDFLSDLVAAALFLDAPARLFPCWELLCPGARLNRARALEHAIENAWPAAMDKGSNPFKSSVLGFWDPKKAAPALLLNATEVETGERVVVAPMSLQSSQTPGLFSLIDRIPTLDVSLSTGIGLSASFPFVSPAGWYPATIATGAQRRTEKRRLVDGGYSDNSGVATALDVIARLQNCPASRPQECSPKARFILLALVSPPSEDGLDNLAYSFGEVATPLRALDSIRSARGRLAVAQAQLLMDRGICPDNPSEAPAPCQTEGAVRKMTLATGDVRVPLGWVLSDRSRQAIECGFAISAPCRPAPADQATIRARETNQKVILQIGRDLQAPN